MTPIKASLLEKYLKLKEAITKLFHLNYEYFSIMIYKNHFLFITKTYYNSVDEILDISLLYSNNFNRQSFKRIINKDQWIIPLKFHENLINLYH
jgi:hypothetical protein